MEECVTCTGRAAVARQWQRVQGLRHQIWHFLQCAVLSQTQVSAAAKAKAVGKRPVATKKPLGKLVRSYYKEYQTHLAIGAVLVVMLVLFLLYLTTPTKAK